MLSFSLIASQILGPVFFPIFERAFYVLSVTGIYWLPPLLLSTFLTFWLSYIRAYYKASVEWALLEIKLPREINKSPRAMEIVFSPFYVTRDGTWPKRWFTGLVRAWFSLEIVSIDGHVHFFIRTPRFFVNLIEAHIYSQYSEVQIIEVDDYTQYVDFGKERSEWDIFGTEFKFSKPDPYPIKTYIDYELDKELKEDKKHIDPLTAVIEYLGSLKQGEQFWLQILIQAAKKRFPDPEARWKWWKKRSWKDEGLDLVKKLMKRDARPLPGEDYVDFSKQILSPGERRVVESIERGISKLGFDCGIRALYLAKKDVYTQINHVATIGLLRPFNAEDMNTFKDNEKKRTDFDYPWQDFKGLRLNYKKRTIFNAYRLRSFFYPPYQRTPVTLSVEELATLYHFPGAVLETPTFIRIPSKTGEPPSNLPT